MVLPIQDPAVPDGFPSPPPSESVVGDFGIGVGCFDIGVGGRAEDVNDVLVSDGDLDVDSDTLISVSDGQSTTRRKILRNG